MSMMGYTGCPHKMSLGSMAKWRKRAKPLAGCKCGVCHIGLLITPRVVTVCSETERQRTFTAEIMSNFATQSCLPLHGGVPLRITHAECDTEYPPR